MNDIIPMFQDIPPLDQNGRPKKRFEVKMRMLGSTPEDGVEKAIFVDGKKLDFAIDITRILEAQKQGLAQLKEIQKETERKFLKSVSDALGRRVKIEEIQAASVVGWI